MKLRTTILAAAAVAAALSGSLLSANAAFAQAKEQFFPVLSGRTGPVAPNATPWANGHNDYMKLVNARGGINGVKIVYEECETAYDTARGVECYERLKTKNGGATLVDPLSTGIAYGILDRVGTDKVYLGVCAALLPPNDVECATRLEVRHGAPVARQKRVAEPLLEALYLHRHGRLRLVHAACRLGEAAAIGDGAEALQLVEVERRAHIQLHHEF